MEINHYLSIARRWMWLLILGLVLGIVSGYVIAKLQTPIYQASTRVVVSRASMQTASGASSGSNGIYDFFLSDQILIQTYVELLKASSIFDHVSQIVNYPVLPSQVTAEQVSDTRIISITVEDANPQHAADIANAVVQALIAQNEELEAGRYKTSDDSLQVQIRQVEDQIAKYQTDLENLSTTTVDEQLAAVEKQMAPLQAEVTQLQKDIAILTPAWSSERKSKVAELQARLDQIQPLLALYQQIYTNLTVSGTSGTGNTTTNNNPNQARLEKTLSLYQQIYLNLINTREAIRLARMQNTQSVNQIEPAAVPISPVRPLPMQSTLLGGLIGLMLAGGIVFLIEFLDDTLKAPEDVERILEIPMIGYIADIEADGNENSNGSIGIYVSIQPRSPVAEAFRSLRTNLEFASVDKPLRTILITSAEASDGKTTIAANLAAIFAQGGKRVMLIDCDLRRPRIHRFVGVQNRVGMTDLFRGTHTLDEVIHTWTDSGALEISIITSGSLPPNPAELLGSQKMNHILEEITARVDVVVIDSPPSMVADAQVLAAKVDGVVLVAQPGKTHAGAARVTHEQLDRAGAHIIGAVFNRIPREHGYYYGGYRYYSPYYYQNNKYVTDNNLNSKFGQHKLEPNETLFQSFLKRVSNLTHRRRAEEIESEDTFDDSPEPILKNVLDPAGWKPREVDEIKQAEDSPAALPHNAEEDTQEKVPDQPSSGAEETKEQKTPPTQFSFLTGGTREQAKSPARSLLRNTATETDSQPSPRKATGERKKTPPQSSPSRTVIVEQKKAPSQASLRKTTAERKKTTPRALLRKAARRIPFASAAPVSKIKLPPTATIRSTPMILRPSDPLISLGSTAVTGALPRHLSERLVGTDYKFLIERASADRNLDYYAARYKTDISSIAAVNYKIPSPAWIIPVGFTDVAQLPSFLAHEVKERGATIATLARDLKVDLTDLKYYNGIKDTDLILTKHWLLVPQHTLPALDQSLKTPAGASSKKHQLDVPIGADQKFVIHKVSGEENLHQYASLYKTRLESILTITLTPPLWSGTIAVIPVEVMDVGSLPRFEAHQVQETGCAVESLARELNVDPNKLIHYNNIVPGEQLQSGDWLLVPRTRSSALWRSASLKPNTSRV